jgi:hypothetical protein
MYLKSNCGEYSSFFHKNNYGGQHRHVSERTAVNGGEVVMFVTVIFLRVIVCAIIFAAGGGTLCLRFFLPLVQTRMRLYCIKKIRVEKEVYLEG